MSARSPNSTRASPFHVCILSASYGGSGSFLGCAVIFDTPGSTSPTPSPPCKVDAKLTKGIGLACHILWAGKIKETNADAITSAGRKEETRVPWQGRLVVRGVIRLRGITFHPIDPPQMKDAPFVGTCVVDDDPWFQGRLVVRGTIGFHIVSKHALENMM